jgi:RHS repeat-associated protein
MTGASFQYDAFGRRVLNAAGHGILYDGVNPVQELSGSTVTANLLTGLGVDEVFTRTDSAGARSFLADALGSTISLTDANGAVQTQYTYGPFGATTATGATSGNSFEFTGRENDGTGLYYYRARYYSPTLQRFISEDPIGFGGGLNFYGYVGNDPTGRIDPLGLDWFDNLTNFVAGAGDALSFGVTRYINDWDGGSAFIDKCSGWYKVGEYTPLALGASRLAYAGAAKAISVLPEVSGAEAGAARNTLKTIFRGGLFPNYRQYTYEELFAKYGSDAAVKAAAGRTSSPLNWLGAYIAASSATNAATSPDCGCRH